MTARLELEQAGGSAGPTGTDSASPEPDGMRVLPEGALPLLEGRDLDPPTEILKALPRGDEADGPSPDSGLATFRRGALPGLAASACVAGLAMLSWVAASGGVLPFGAQAVAPISVILAGLVCGALLRHRRSAFRARMRYVSDAVIRLAEGTAISTGKDPLAGVLLEVAGRIEERARIRLKEQEVCLRAESKRDMVRVRSQCEKLVEKYAERALEDRKAAQKALDEMVAERERERRQQEVDRQAEENRLHEAEEAARELRDRNSALESELSELKDECRQLDADIEGLRQEREKLKGQDLVFFDKVAAQLRGPIQIIMNLAGDLARREASKDGAPPATLEQCARDVQNRAAQLSKLVDQLLDLCRVQSSTLSVVFSEVDVARFAARTVADLGQEAKERGVQLGHSVPAKLPPVLTDGRLFAKIFRELVGNAVHYTPRGGRVSISAEILHGDPPLGCPTVSKDREYLRFEVSDTGPGIAPEDRERIFDAFVRGSDPKFTVSDAKPGLGLALARSYARLLGGDVLLESEVGRGSRFRVVLPVKVYARAAF